MPTINRYREFAIDLSKQSPEEILAGVPDVNDTDARARRRNLLDELKNRASEWITALDMRGPGPSLDEANRIAEDLERILSEIRR